MRQVPNDWIRKMVGLNRASKLVAALTMILALSMAVLPGSMLPRAADSRLVTNSALTNGASDFSNCGFVLSECTAGAQKIFCIFRITSDLSDCKVEETDYTTNPNGIGSGLQTNKGLDWAGPGELASVTACAALGGIPLLSPACSPLDPIVISGVYAATGCALVTAQISVLAAYLASIGVDPVTTDNALCAAAGVGRIDCCSIVGMAVNGAPDSGIMLAILSALPAPVLVAAAPLLAAGSVLEYIACGDAFTSNPVAPSSCAGRDIISTFLSHSLFQTQFIPGGVLPYTGTIGWTKPICGGGLNVPGIAYPRPPDCLPQGSSFQPGSAGDNNGLAAIRCAVGRVVLLGITWDGDVHTDLAPISGFDTPSSVAKDAMLGSFVNVNNTNGGGVALDPNSHVSVTTAMNFATPHFTFPLVTEFGKDAMDPNPAMAVEIPVADRANFDLADVKGGQILQVCGHWVTDSNRGEAWNELHPVTSLAILSETSISKFFTDSSLIPLLLDSKSNPAVNVTLAGGIVRSANPGQVLAWANVTNTSGSPIQSLKLDDTLPVSWIVSPPWKPATGAIHVLYANGTSLANETDITQPSTITVSTSNPQVIHLVIPNLSATAIGHALMPGKSILLSAKLSYGLVGTTQSATNYPINYTDVAVATAWSQAPFSGTESVGSGFAFFTADAKVVS